MTDGEPGRAGRGRIEPRKRGRRRGGKRGKTTRKRTGQKAEGHGADTGSAHREPQPHQRRRKRATGGAEVGTRAKKLAV